MKKYLIMFAAAMLAFSCGDDKDTNDNPEGPKDPTPPVETAFITLSTAEYTFPKDGGTSPQIEVS